METHGTPPPKPTRPPVPAASPPRNGLVISKRLLWVYGAAYPLENIVRVYTFVLRPRRAEAFGRFLKRGGITLAVLLILMNFTDSSSSSYEYGSDGSDLDDVLSFVLACAALLLAYYFGVMASVVFARSHDVLAVETNGRSTALVTGKREYLDRLVREIAEAIDKPNAEFQASVGTLAVTNYGNYYFGDAVNMYGGSGNTGMVK
ncbi:DUF6232 family protein [Streptomyces sp. NK15101]|uniref:DUF6232 family protein n=1 Tax=Streptomyces sp. NK15101 TaxID=2873261 RepID=UPI001CED0937|nr:DUF6232 family protein [Streptomyces sp. NK15101]